MEGGDEDAGFGDESWSEDERKLNAKNMNVWLRVWALCVQSHSGPEAPSLE